VVAEARPLDALVKTIVKALDDNNPMPATSSAAIPPS
jgi:hypothetical protein